MGTTSAAPPHEQTAWMRRTISRRVAELDRRGPWIGVAVAPLGRPTARGQREDRTCDRCRTYVDRNTFYCAAIHVRPDVVLVVGLCAGCGRREGWKTEAG